MEIETILSVKRGDKLEFFPEFGLWLEDGGLRLKARSPLFAELVKQQGKVKKRSIREGNEDARVWANLTHSIGEASPLAAYGVDFYGISFPANQGEIQANLVWLAHPDLATGISLDMPTILPINEVEQLFTSSVQRLTEMYENFLRTAVFQAKLQEVFHRG